MTKSAIQISSLLLTTLYVNITIASESSILIQPANYADMEALRPLVEGCSDLGELENLRSNFDAASDYETMRPILELQGEVEFYGCDSDSKYGVSK